MSQRTDRVDELLRQEIGAILAREVADPRIGFATVTDVETTRDLAHAKVWVSVIGDAAERRATVAALERAMGFVRRELGVRLRLRRIPELHVELDASMERGTRVLQILDELEHGDTPRAASLADAPITETLPTPVARLPRAGDTPQPEAEPGPDAAADVGEPGMPAGAVAPGEANAPAGVPFARRRRRDGGPRTFPISGRPATSRARRPRRTG
jgi:ribosome-binding factor A